MRKLQSPADLLQRHSVYMNPEDERSLDDSFSVPKLSLIYITLEKRKATELTDDV